MRSRAWVSAILAVGLALSAASAASAQGVKALSERAGVQLGEPLKFYCQLEGIDASRVKSFAWDFGDGGSSLEQNPSYTFKDEGTYSVTVTVTLTDGKKFNATVNVQAQKECQC